MFHKLMKESLALFGHDGVVPLDNIAIHLLVESAAIRLPLGPIWHCSERPGMLDPTFDQARESQIYVCGEWKTRTILTMVRSVATSS